MICATSACSWRYMHLVQLPKRLAILTRKSWGGWFRLRVENWQGLFQRAVACGLFFGIAGTILFTPQAHQRVRWWWPFAAFILVLDGMLPPNYFVWVSRVLRLSASAWMLWRLQYWVDQA